MLRQRGKAFASLNYDGRHLFRQLKDFDDNDMAAYKSLWVYRVDRTIWRVCRDDNGLSLPVSGVATACQWLVCHDATLVRLEREGELFDASACSVKTLKAPTEKDKLKALRISIARMENSGGNLR